MISRPDRNNQNSDKEFELTPAGTHICSLKLKDCEVAKWAKDDKGKLYKTDEKRDGVRFIFKVDGKDWYVLKSLPKTEHENGGLLKFMRTCSDSMLKEIKFNDKNFAEDTTLFYDILEKLQENKYSVDVVHNESNGRTYANIESVTPLTQLPKEVNADVSFEDDEVPF